MTDRESSVTFLESLLYHAEIDIISLLLIAMWFEPLPNQCPPGDATTPNGVYFRVTETSQATCEDFWSHRKLNPDQKYNTNECRAMAVSVFDSSQAAQKLLLMERHRHKVITAVKLDSNAGKIQKNGQPNHFSWWRAVNFPVLENLVV